ncbi:MAG: hypothetical protein JST86_03645 [Bacteroidetes bacterium]|nr:hypothetical protein [Bacteroidota bacterium]
MKFLLVIVMVLLVFPAAAQVVVMAQWSGKEIAESGDTIFYTPSTKLEWKDFEGKPGAPYNAIAVTASGFGYDAVMKRTNNVGSIYITVFCYFSKKDSWVRTGRESSYALNHEQNHFNIAYLAAWRFLDSLQKTTMTLQNYGDVIERTYNFCYKYMQQMQDSYDGETHNGLFTDEQETWNEKLKELMKKN